MTTQKNIKISVSGPVLPGAISTAMAKCGTKGCRCQTDPDYRHGPYYRWTGVIDGKRTTVTLSKKEAEECSRRIKRWKKLQQQIALIAEKAIASAPWYER